MSLEQKTTLESSLPSDPEATHDPAAKVETPIIHLDRFRLERLLGRGGMGQVWEAWDPKLNRQVAIKRLLRGDFAARRRFLREARLQATIAHPGICPVFEAGHDAGEPYIVMPRLEGTSLDQAVEGSPLEYKLDLMRQVAEAVHAAHQQGLIHRDLKPSNILVEHPADAPPRPIVLDFGIARPIGEEGITASGQLVGTPAYMAPEQVEGGPKQLDRRTDVYALGATLYRLLTGCPPHTGEGIPLLLSITNEEPERLPSGDIPAEVEAIVFKCLEKEKNKRYDSALALAEDLARYLAGEPVHARPVTQWIRLGKWMRRHRIAVRVTAATAFVALAALAWGGWSAWRSEERQDAARRFGAQVEEIEALARYSHLLPLHDTRPDQAELRKRLDAIRPSLEDRDSVVRALASHALGRGHLALDELEPAREFLESAYELDPDNPEIAADLGRTLSELYRDRLATLEQIRDSEGHESVREQLSSRLAGTFRKTGEQQKQWQRSLEDPARGFLASGRTAEASNTVELDALILFHEGDPEAALDFLRSAPPAPAWAYERLRLEGDILRSWGASLAAAGDADEEARKKLEEARHVYGRALEIAPSHSALLIDDAQTISLSIQMGLVPTEDVEPLIDEAREILRQARRIDLERLENWLWTARLELEASTHAFDLAQDPSSQLAKALSAAREALKIDDQASEVWFYLAQTHKNLGRWHRVQGEDPKPDFELASQAFDRIAVEDQDYFYHMQLGILRTVQATHRAERGLEAHTAYQAAIDSYHAAAEKHSAPFGALVNLAVALFEAASLDGANPQKILAQAIEILGQAHQRRPEHMVPLYYLGLCRSRLAQGGDLARTIIDDDMAERAQADFEKAIELAPEHFAPWVGLGELLHLRAVAAYNRGLDPVSFFARARQAHNSALKLAPSQPNALLNLAWTAYFEGKFALRGGADPMAQLAEAERLCRKSLDNNRRPNALLCLGSVWRMQAEHHLNRDEFNIAGSHINAAKSMFEEMLSLDANHAEAYRSIGRLITLEAQKLRIMGEDPTRALTRSRGFLDRALELESSMIDFHLADARWHLEQAKWLRTSDEDFTQSISTGQRSLARVYEWKDLSAEALSLSEELRAFDQ